MDTALRLENMTRAIYNERGPQFVHPGQWAILRYVASRPGANVCDVAVFLGITHAPSSRAVSALIKKGLLSRLTDQADRRVRRLIATERGNALLRGDPLNRLAQALEELDEDQRRQLDDTLQALMRRLKTDQICPLQAGSR